MDQFEEVCGYFQKDISKKAAEKIPNKVHLQMMRWMMIDPSGLYSYVKCKKDFRHHEIEIHSCPWLYLELSSYIFECLNGILPNLVVVPVIKEFDIRIASKEK